MEQIGKKKKKHKLTGIIILVLVLGGGAFAVNSFMKNAQDALQEISAMQIETIKAERRDLSESISVSGTVESENMVKVTSKLNAKVQKINVEVGSRVNAGDVLCIFDSSDFQQQYDNLSQTQQNTKNQSENQHKINLRNLETAKREKQINLEQAQRAIDDAKKSRDEIYAKEAKLVNELNEQIVRRGDAQNKMDTTDDPEEYQKAMQTYQEADALVQSKEASLEAVRDQFSTYDKAIQSAEDAYAAAERSADASIQNYQDILDAEQFQQDHTSQTELDKLADSIAQCTVIAPKSGIITALNIAEGSIPTTDALMTIEDTDALKIKVQINEADILTVKEGMPAIVKTSATGDKEFEASVTRVINIYDSGNLQQNSAGGYSAEITVKDDSKLLIGMTAKVKIILNDKKEALSVPYESILTNDDGSKYVLITEPGEDGTTKAKAVSVETGLEGVYYTEIISGDLKEGDTVIMTPGDYRDGDILPIGSQGEDTNA